MLLDLTSTIAPNVSKSRFLAQNYNAIVHRSSIRMLLECERKLARSCCFDIPSLCPTKRLTPGFHYGHHRLQESMRSALCCDVTSDIEYLAGQCGYEPLEGDEPNISSIGTSYWERFSIKEASRLSLVEQRKMDVIQAVPDAVLNSCAGAIRRAMQLTRMTDENLYAEVGIHVSCVRIFDSKVTRGFSDLRVMGAIFINRPPLLVDWILYFYEQIIHEMSHIQLNCIFAMDRLFFDDRAKRMRSPLRKDERPAFGVFHATYVSVKVAYSFYRLYRVTGNSNLIVYLLQTMDEAVNGIDVIRNMHLTKLGRKLVGSMLDAAREIASDRIWTTYDFSVATTHRYGAGSVAPVAFGGFVNADTKPR